jgi:hypothetical protein
MKLVECIESIDIENMDCDTCIKMQEILSDEIEDEGFLSFAIDNLEELSSYIINGKLNIRIHRNDVDELWFDVDEAENNN